MSEMTSRFAGALETKCIEAMMQDGRALQAGTSHDLGQNFGKAFDVTFQNQSGEREHVWQTSWGVSTRLIGALIMTHSDDGGLVLPPKLAPIHVAIVPIYKNDEERVRVMAVAEKVAADLRDDGLSVKLDDRAELKPGAKYYEWERRSMTSHEIPSLANSSAASMQKCTGRPHEASVQSVPARRMQA